MDRRVCQNLSLGLLLGRGAIVVLLGLAHGLAHTGLIAEDTATPAEVAADADGTDGLAIYPSDLLDITVFDHPDLTTSIRVPASGTFAFPLIGKIGPVLGMTHHSLAAEIGERLEDGFLRQAHVTIVTREFGPRTAYVMGSVERPGSFQLNPALSTSALQAIGHAGGYTEDADQRATHLIRTSLDGTNRQVIPLQADNDNTDLTLLPGDIVIIPRRDRVYVVGEVRDAGPVKWPEDQILTVSKAITAAGGFLRFARRAEVQVIREGKRLHIVNVEALLAGKANDDPVLKPGDTVFVPESRF